MKAALVILDGWGIGAGDDTDAVAAAHTPEFEKLQSMGAYGTLKTHGRHVGLLEGQMGNSEVGHLTIGAGRIVTQEAAQITDDIRSSQFSTNTVLAKALESAKQRASTVHFMGLVSDGGVHSFQTHLHALIKLAADRNIEAITHAFTDGRDTAPSKGREYITQLSRVIKKYGTGTVGTVCGRYYAMDRDENWERTKCAYDAIVNREAPYTADSALDAIEDAYARGDRPDEDYSGGQSSSEGCDEFIVPTVINGTDPISEGDVVIMFNFRADRVRQLVRMVGDISPVWSFETSPPPVELVTMTEYDKTFELPVAYPPTEPSEPLGAVIAEYNLTQLRLAESEKYAHVTYFLNGGREIEFPGEFREIVSSPDVATYDLQPEMSAHNVTDAAMQWITTDNPDVVIVNYANPDMVGHTGVFSAAKAAVEAVDTQLGRLSEAVFEADGHLFITADHGNADDMGTSTHPHTAHTKNPVPFMYIAPDRSNGDYTVREDGTLADISPTILSEIEVPIPNVMTGQSLLIDS